METEPAKPERSLPMMRITLVLLVALAVAPSPETNPGRRGPPLICFEIDIGTAASLPWKTLGYGMGPEPTFDVAKVIPETLRVLAASNDSLVHMETLRRAYVYLHHDVTDLGQLLKNEALRASLPDTPTSAPDARRETLAWFDLAYLVAIVSNNGNGECGFLPGVPCHKLLERAAAGAPKDAALRFGVAIGQAFNWCPGGVSDADEKLWRSQGWKHLGVSLDLVGDSDSLVAKNIRFLFGSDYGPDAKPTTLQAVRKMIAGMSVPESRPR
jgi:hypothetical protein